MHDSLYSTTEIPERIMYAEPEIYINTIGNIHDWASLVKFYDMMFSSNPMVFITVCFVGLYAGLLIYEKYSKNEVIHNDCNKN